MFLDTRTKILTLPELQDRLKNRAFRCVSGYFDPLVAEHVRRLTEVREPGRPLVVEVTNPRQPLLAQRARAELVAALAMVDYVVLGDEEAGLDADISERFIEDVLLRHGQESRR